MNRNPEKPLEATGTVVFLMFYAGTKSESKYPFLYIDRNTIYRLSRKGNISFDDRELRPYDGKRVRVSGMMKEDINPIYAAGTLVADSIELEEEAPERPSASE